MKEVRRIKSRMLAVMLAGALTIGNLSVSTFGAWEMVDSEDVASTSEVAVEEVDAEVETADTSAQAADSEDNAADGPTHDFDTEKNQEDGPVNDDTPDQGEQEGQEDNQQQDAHEEEQIPLPDNSIDAGNEISEDSEEITVDYGQARQNLGVNEVDGDDETVSSNAVMGVVASGMCGENVTWMLDEEGTLTISGTGEMADGNYDGNDNGSYFGWNVPIKGQEVDLYKIVEKVVLNEGITTIGDYAFQDMEQLAEVYIPNSVQRIGKWAFKNCSMLQEISMPDSVSVIGNAAFSSCTRLQTVRLPDGLEIIDTGTFAWCSSLCNIEIPTSVKRIYPSAFGSTAVSKILLPDDLEWLGNEAFYGTNLTEISIPNASSYFGYSVFAECKSLKKVVLGEGLMSIPPSTFRGCTELKELVIPGTVLTIQNMAFANCTSLEKVVFIGCAPIFGKYINSHSYTDTLLQFEDDTLVAYYPSGDATWTDDKRVTYGGNITWKEWHPNISQCNMTLPSTSYIYDKSAKKPIITISDGLYTLDPNTDYTVSYSNNINAGTATVTATGKGLFTGTVSKDFYISKALPSLYFVNTAVSKTTIDDSFTNTLTKTTDGTVTFSSSDTSVAEVDKSSGRVTPKGAGTAKITASAAAGKNYKAGSASYTLTVTKASAGKFSDVSSKYAFFNEIEWAADKGIVGGYADGTFKPQGECKRKQVVAFLWRLKGTPAPKSTKARFSDVSTKTDFYKAIYWASENNIVLGFGNGTFKPEDTCTRGQVVAFLWRIAGRPAPKGSASKFSDVAKTNSFYKAILWASENGIVNGYSDGTFRPDNTCTRGQIVAFIYRYANKK